MSMIPPEPKLIDLQKLLPTSWQRFGVSLLASPLEKTLGLTTLNKVYREASRCETLQDFFAQCLHNLRVRYVLAASDRQKIPETGALILVANHPFGGLEGLILGDVLLQCRPDVKFLGNYLLQHIPAMRDHVIPVNPFGHRSATMMNVRGLQEAIRWVRSGGLLVTFPAGEVSHWDMGQRRVTDPLWCHHISAVIRHTQAPVLPGYFPGRNSLLFQTMGLLHPLLRTVLLPHELTNKCAQTITVAFGQTIPWRKLARFSADVDLMAYLRMHTYVLDNRQERSLRRFRMQTWRPRQTAHAPVMLPVEASSLQQDIARLPAEHCLVDSKEFAVYLAEAAAIPAILQEIGRLREVTFRQVGEGTGRATDLDRFDEYYRHLFVWNKHRHEVVGAYRIGLAGEILRQHGVGGLYTNTLFRFQPAFLQQLDHALELGRSFVRIEYQKKYGCLALLWQGIGAFLVRHPQYRLLFGPVSISQDYLAVSKKLMVHFLRTRKLHTDFARYVHPRHPYREGKVRAINLDSLCASLQDVDEVSWVIASLEQDGKGLPLLLHYYLKLNATLISFNVDKAFSNAVDGLIFLDVTQVEPRTLRRFMGEAGYQAFIRHPTHLPLAG